MIKGKITRISGPVIYAEGLGNCGLYDVVDVGKKKIIGESWPTPPKKSS